jgi:hypothetical protein
MTPQHTARRPSRTPPEDPRPLTADTAARALAATARNVMDRIRYMMLGTIDEGGCTRTSPVYFVPHRYRDLYWVSTPTSHHSHN